MGLQVADFGLSRVLTAEAISTGTYGAPPASGGLCRMR